MKEQDKIDKFWLDSGLREDTKRSLSIGPSTLPSAAVDDKVKQLVADAEFEANLKAAIGAGLLILSFVPGVAPVAGAVGLALGAADVVGAFQEFYWQEAATGTATERCRPRRAHGIVGSRRASGETPAPLTPHHGCATIDLATIGLGVELRRSAQRTALLPITPGSTSNRYCECEKSCASPRKTHDTTSASARTGENDGSYIHCPPRGHPQRHRPKLRGQPSSPRSGEPANNKPRPHLPRAGHQHPRNHPAPRNDLCGSAGGHPQRHRPKLRGQPSSPRSGEPANNKPRPHLPRAGHQHPVINVGREFRGTSVAAR